MKPDTLLLYGAGGFGQKLCDQCRANGIEVTAMFDEKKTGDYRGVPIRPVADMCQYRSDFPVVLAVFNPYANPEDIINNLESFGCDRKRVLFPSEFYHLMRDQGCRLNNVYWLSQEDSVTNNSSAFDARKLFSEPLSRSIYDSEIKARQTGLFDLALSQFDSRMYRSDVVPVTTDFSFADVGAFNGDTIEDFVRHNINFKEIYAFEPDPANIRQLHKKIQTLNLKCPVTVFPLGLHNQMELLRFSEDQGASSTVSEQGKLIIQGVALDELLINKPVNYVKIDIEGNEINALMGMSNIIQNQRPLIAVSVYHVPDHLWKIPLLLKQMVPEYELYLRIHGYNGFDTVCYAVLPNN